MYMIETTLIQGCQALMITRLMLRTLHLTTYDNVMEHYDENDFRRLPRHVAVGCL
jgi:hypothetical protein